MIHSLQKTKQSIATVLLGSVLFGLLLGASAFFGMRQPLFVGSIFFVLLPSLIFLRKAATTTLFERVKFSTILIGNTTLVLVGLGLLPTVLFLWLLLYRVNIVEAAVSAYRKKRYWTLLGSGSMLVGTLNMFVYWTSTTMHATAPAMAALILAYVIWNSNFVLGEFGYELAFYHLGVQLAAIVAVVMANDLSLWLMARSYTLLVGGALHVGYKEQIQKFFHQKLFSSISDRIETQTGQISLFVVVTVLNLLTFLPSLYPL